MNRLTTVVVTLGAVFALSHADSTLAQSARDEGAKRGFNPQPEPPRSLGPTHQTGQPAVPTSPVDTASKGIGVGELTPGSTQGFNPQPDPPGSLGPTHQTGQPAAPTSPVDTARKGIGVGELPSGSTQGFNPQPEPPRAKGGPVGNSPASNSPKFLTGIGPLRPGTTQGLNPQPEPPTRPGGADIRVTKQGLVNPGTVKGFNPQPEPPAAGRVGMIKSPGMGTAITTPGSTRAFNPQPEPPAQRGGATAGPAMQKVAPAGRVMAPSVKTR